MVILMAWFAALAVTEIAMLSIVSAVASQATATMVNHIETDLIFMSLRSTLSATSLIGYRIYTASQNNILQSQKKYNCIATKLLNPPWSICWCSFSMP